MRTLDRSLSPALIAVLAALLWLPVAVRAGSVTATADAAFSGSFGLEVEPGSTCFFEEREDLDGQSVLTDVDACSFITAVDTTIDAAGVDFLAGISISFGNGFSVSSGASFTATLDSSLPRLAYVQDRTPNSESTYKASFRLRLDELDLLLSPTLTHLTGLSDDGTVHFEVRLKHVLLPAPGEDRLVLSAREDNGTVLDTTGAEVMLPAGYNLIAIDWRAGDGTGRLVVSLNGVPFGGLTDLDNDEARIDTIRWGVTDGDVQLTGGFLEIDDFVSTR